MPDIPVANLTKEQVHNISLAAHPSGFIKPLCRTLLAYMEAVEGAPHGSGCDARRCGICDEQAEICEEAHAFCIRFKAKPCGCWKGKLNA